MNESANKFGLAFRRPLSRAKTFASDEGGSMYVLAMFLFVTMLIFSGLAIDFMRYELHRTRLQATLDRAILAAANPNRKISESVGQEKARKAVVLDYFKRAGLESTIDESSITVTTSQGQSIVEASAALNITTPFLDWSGVSKLSAPAAGRAEKGVALTEISLILDVSGSMNDDGKLASLKEAAIEFNNLLLCDPADPSKSTDCSVPKPDVANGVIAKTSVSLVPYAAYVNAGDELLQAFDPIGAHDQNTCATFAAESYSKIGIVPTPDASGLALMTAEEKRDFLMHQSSKAMMLYSVGSTSATNKSYKEETYRENLTPCYRKSDSWREIKPYQHSAEKLKTHVEALTASGNTSIEMGLKWGTTLLHPAAQPVITELATAKPVFDTNGDPVKDGNGLPVMTVPTVHETFKGRPYNPNTTSSRKIVVLMTDGFNTSSIEMKSKVRTGESPIYVTKPQKTFLKRSGRTPEEKNGGNVLSVYNPNTGKYRWHFTVETQYGTAYDYIVKDGADHPFGTVATDCFAKSDYYWDSSYGDYRWAARTICANYPDPAAPAEPVKLTYDQFWGDENYYPNFLKENFPWILGSNVSPSTKVYSGSKNTRLLAQCRAAENAGIVVVAIDMSSGNSTMEKCASTASLDGSAKQVKQYYKVSTTSIADTFRKLANDINKLRLTK